MSRAARSASRPAPALVAGLLASLLLAGCGGLPDSGGIQPVKGPEAGVDVASFDFDPPGPARGATPRQIVGGFLRALQATPLSTRVATEFLTTDAAASWRPGLRTVVYGAQRMRSSASGVTVTLDDAFELDRTGRWAGADAPETDVEFKVTREDGEWRISEVPNATVIPDTHFVTRYREYSLYFFDAAGQVLVPEPVYLPWGVQAPTQLVAGLLAGPRTSRRAVERSFFPRGTRLGVSVPVGPDGTGQVPLSDEMRDLDDQTLQRALAQLVWTLRQVGEVRRVGLSVDGTPVELPDGGATVTVDGWSEYSPTVASASTDLFGVRGRDIVQVVGGSELEMASFAGSGVRRPRALGVSMTGQRFAVVSDDGTRVLTLGLSGQQGSRTETTYQGTDVLRPMWDRTDRLWVIDRTAQGAALSVLEDGRLRRVPTGLDGLDVLAAALSRDGTRLAAAVAGPGGSTRLLVLGVVRQRGGSPVRLTAPMRIATPRPLVGVRAVGWRDPTSIAVLTRPSATTSEVVLGTVDGSSSDVVLESAEEVLFDVGISMAASPSDPPALIVVTRDGLLHSLDVTGRWNLEAVPSGLGSPTYVG